MSEFAFKDHYAAARAGDEAAFARIVSRFRDRLERFIDRRMGAQVRRRCEPDDIFQNVMLTLLGRISGYPGDLDEDELRAYAFQIAKWKIADVLKRGDREGGESVLPSAELPAGAPSEGPVTLNDERRWTREEIATLPDTFADVMRLYYVEGKSASQIATDLELSLDNVKQRLSRGRARLRDRWRSEDGHDA